MALKKHVFLLKEERQRIYLCFYIQGFYIHVYMFHDFRVVYSENISECIQIYFNIICLYINFLKADNVKLHLITSRISDYNLPNVPCLVPQPAEQEQTHRTQRHYRSPAPHFIYHRTADTGCSGHRRSNRSK